MNHFIFDRSLVIRRRARQGRNFLLDEMAARMRDRVADFTRNFSDVLVIGAPVGIAAEQVEIGADEILPVLPEKFDLAVCVDSLHWVNDLPGMLVQIRRALKKDGLFIGMMPGGQTLKELRASLEAAELAETGGVSPRVSPFIDVKDAGSLLSRAGFALPVADSESLTISYESPLALLKDLRDFGQSNALLARIKTPTRRAVLFKAMEYYAQHFADKDGRVKATVELVGMTGFK